MAPDAEKRRKRGRPFTYPDHLFLVLLILSLLLQLDLPGDRFPGEPRLSFQIFD
jgi:hypothetical protein